MSYYLIIERAVKIAVDRTWSSDKFAARTTTSRCLSVSGPFRSRKLAERAMLKVLGTFTCFSVELLSHEQMVSKAMAAGTTYDTKVMIMAFLKYHQEEVASGAEETR